MNTDPIISVKSGGSYVALPIPSSYKVIDMAIFSHAERNVEYTHTCDLGAVKKQITMSWNFLKPAEFKSLCTLTAPVKGSGTSSDRVYIDVSYYDPQRDEFCIGSFYRDSSFDYSVVGVWDEKPQGVTCSMTLTEQ